MHSRLTLNGALGVTLALRVSPATAQLVAGPTRQAPADWLEDCRFGDGAGSRPPSARSMAVHP